MRKGVIAPRRAQNEECVLGLRAGAIVAPGTPTCSESAPANTIGLQARLPNGVAIDLHGLQGVQIAAVIETLGRLPCSVSTRA